MEPSTTACNICGSTEFKPGPAGRLNRGLKPGCISCGSLERHRVYRLILDALIGQGQASGLKALQFSRDPSIDGSWFMALDHSIYGHQNSLDIQDIDLPSGAYDIVICNHIIEHVPDDRAAFREVSRIVSRKGFAFVSVPTPAERENTRDWGFPDWSQHGHYRVYGADIVERIKEAIPEMWIAQVRAEDPVTRGQDLAFIFSHEGRWHDQSFELGLRAESVNRPIEVAGC